MIVVSIPAKISITDSPLKVCITHRILQINWAAQANPLSSLFVHTHGHLGRMSTGAEPENR
jgi:hypothetical protein